MDQEQASIPVIDLSFIDENTGDKLTAAAAEHGFVYIRGIGLDIDENMIDNMFGISQKFFRSPREVKQAYAMNPDKKGWAAMYSETLDPEHQKRGDCKEAFNFAQFAQGKAQQPLPESFKVNEAALDHFTNLCHSLCLKLLRLFALGLKIDPDAGGDTWLSSRHDPSEGTSGSTLRLLYYPAPGGYPASYDTFSDVRAGAHSDYGSITLLFQRRFQPGLEILDRNSTWSPVPVFPPGTENDIFPPVLINIGDILDYWTSGLLRSTIHRVVFPREGCQADRYSIAYFCHPVDTTELVPVPSKLVRRLPNEMRNTMNGRQKSKAITAGEHLQKRLAAIYGGPRKDSPT